MLKNVILYFGRINELIKLKKILGQIIGILILLGFFVGLIAVIFVPVEMSKMADAQTWPSRPGVITHSSASEVFSKRRGSYWSYVIRGTFSDTGEPFVITKVRYGGFWLGKGKSQCQGVVARYPRGSIVQVFYSPTRPNTMILEPFASWDDMYLVLSIGLGLVFLPFVLYLFRKQPSQN